MLTLITSDIYNLKTERDAATCNYGRTYTYATEMLFLDNGQEPTRKKKRVLEMSEEGEADDEKLSFLFITSIQKGNVKERSCI